MTRSSISATNSLIPTVTVVWQKLRTDESCWKAAVEALHAIHSDVLLQVAPPVLSHPVDDNSATEVAVAVLEHDLSDLWEVVVEDEDH